MILKKYEIDTSLVMLELTEGVLIQNFEDTVKKLHHLKSLGISLSIDDFGTGYSSLSYLKKLPVNELKIDKSFINDLIEDENDEIITQTIISIGQKFGLDVIAEGVETQEQFEKLRSIGCNLFQGYLFAKPTKVELL
jgi:EAL domain-containing protein (putative c-di-GMP-specific phosphodiesterase class I)